MKKWIIFGVLGFIIIAGLIWGWRYATAPIEGRIGVQEQIQSKETIITAYNHFFNLYAAIKSYDITLSALEEQLEQVSSEEERERVLATIAGVKSQKGRAIEQYNADAQKSYTIGQFREWSLPYHIEQ